MRKSILLFLFGMMAVVGAFISFEQINIFIVILLSFGLGFIFYVKNSKLIYFFLAFAITFLSAKVNFHNKELRFYKPDTYKFTVYEKRKMEEGYRYFLLFENNKKHEKTVSFMEDDLSIGEVFLAKANFKSPQTNTNPNLFSYRKYLSSKEIFSETEIKKIYKKVNTNNLGLKLRNDFYNYVHKVFENNMSKRSADFCISVVLGENIIDDNSIRDLGLSHILAVSGLHIDLLFTFILFILRKLRINYKISYSFALILALIYGYLIAFPFSVIRVIGVNIIGYLAFLYKKPFDKIKATLIIAVLILLINPFAILNTGFILSFVASFSILLIYPKFERKFGKTYFRKIFIFTLAIQLGTLPFLVYYFGRINILTILANFLVLPIFNISMYLIFIVLLFSPLFGTFLKIGFLSLDFLVRSMLNITAVLSRVNISVIDFNKPNFLLALYGFLLVLILVNLERKLIKRNINLLMVSAMILILSLASDFNKVSYQMIDIGQGDSFLINDRGNYYLIDVGGPNYKTYNSGEKVLVPYLKSLGIKNIEGIFISHEDNDHMGNLDLVCDNFNVYNIYSNKLNVERLKKYKPVVLNKNDKINLSSGYIECIYEGSDGEENANSLGLLINIKGIRILSLGDLPSEYEREIDKKADILKLSHHGSKTSSDRGFIEKIDPQIVLISAGRNNKYGHPNEEVLKNVSDRLIYNTQDDGLVEIDLTKNLRINTYLKGGYFR
ncbi:DNA internalization-related competence protein ComEC/Rec2 [uncultured Anaerococcus sp.]|uniref:DNA internalization-related competence protein ComEC/Rec2 n=1 Tax=uncultured Anaerococcus sp. TaxID=293428 RepID=UPI00280B27CA|nr:DNA internalization-related competence protein ComEC/Rec2 [uncultured Anaerococcus sp.]MDU5149285.1 DNA internalization-related competence protein ComEC/Rec2 [Anaerococcus prevotii]